MRGNTRISAVEKIVIRRRSCGGFCIVILFVVPVFILARYNPAMSNFQYPVVSPVVTTVESTTVDLLIVPVFGSKDLSLIHI